MDKPLTRIEYSGSKRKPKQMCENPGRQVELSRISNIEVLYAEKDRLALLEETPVHLARLV
jgi:hypothetical protein